MSDPTDRQKAIATYIADLCAGLVDMAEGANLTMLAYVLDMARIEAQATVAGPPRSGRTPSGPRGRS